MNLRPSTTILSVAGAPDPSATHAALSLRRRIVALVGGVAAIVVLVLAYVGLAYLSRSMGAIEDARILSATSLSKQLVDRVLDERARQVELIASSPSVIEAAKSGIADARRLGLPETMGNVMPPAQLDAIEQRFKATRSMQVDPGANAYLTGLLPKLDIAEVMVTDDYGYNAVTTSPSSDFVQSDEGWWQAAWANGMTTAQATADPATQRTVVELAGVIRDGAKRVGVAKVKFGLSLVDSVLAQGSAGGAALRVDLVDSTGKVIASSVPSVRFKPFAGFQTVSARDAGATFQFAGDSGSAGGQRRGAVAKTNLGQWRVVAHMSEADATHAYRAARAAMLGGVAVMIALIVALLAFVSRFVERRITGPAGTLAAAAEAVAAGDLSKRVSQLESDDEIGRLSRAVAAMIAELRRLAAALNESASETATMTAEINASSEEMAASAGQIAHTAADLSQQSNVMAETIQVLAGSSEQLVTMAVDLSAGAHEGVERNGQLRSLALANRGRLDDSSRSLATLAGDAEASASAIEQLAAASEEIRSFVSLVQKLARQSKLLALNAAMEAARAGEHGHGFAVVAEEVRRLAAMSSDAAERTERVVSGVLRGISQSRDSTGRTVETVRVVRAATDEGSRSFGEIERAVAEADGWTTSIEQMAATANALSRELRAKLDSLAAGTESFAAAMEEVAASSEEQSASTEQIAAAAGTLSGAADRLSRLAGNLRLEEAAPERATPLSTEAVRLPAGVRIGGRMSGSTTKV